MLSVSYILCHKGYAMFSEFLGIIEAVARLNDNATKGAIQRMNSHMTVGQVERRIKSLVADGYLHSKVEPHGRTGKIVYYLSNVCSTNMHITNNAIDEAGYLNGSEA